MESTNNSASDDHKCCAKCGKRRSSDNKLSKCSRCLIVKYCSRECQRLDWKRHKRTECGDKATLPPKASRDFLAANLRDLASSTFRAVLVQAPKNVLCCCWCCGMLLKVCGERGLNPSQDPAGPFWTDTFGRVNEDVPVKGKTFPALCILGEPGSTGYYTGVNSFNQASACLFCAAALKENDKRAEKHIKRCEKYLWDEKFRSARHLMSDLSMAEQRILAQIVIDQDPNLSDGILSIGGYLRKEGNNKKIAVPYSYRLFEHLAFPSLLCDAAEFEGETTEELYHYTAMRLYSADETWRSDMDYVSFSILRLAAYGHESSREALRQLSPPKALANAADTQIQFIGMVKGFD